MPRTKDLDRHAEKATEQVVDIYTLVRDELRAKTRLKQSLEYEVEKLQAEHDRLFNAAVALGVTEEELSSIPESKTNEAKVILTS